jgi:hypothetical protein
MGKLGQDKIEKDDQPLGNAGRPAPALADHAGYQTRGMVKESGGKEDQVGSGSMG